MSPELDHQRTSDPAQEALDRLRSGGLVSRRSKSTPPDVVEALAQCVRDHEDFFTRFLSLQTDLGLPRKSHHCREAIKQALPVLILALNSAGEEKTEALVAEAARLCRSHNRLTEFCTNGLSQLLECGDKDVGEHFDDVRGLLQERRNRLSRRQFQHFIGTDLKLYHEASLALDPKAVKTLLAENRLRDPSERDIGAPHYQIHARLHGRQLALDEGIREVFTRAGLRPIDYVSAVDELTQKGEVPTFLRAADTLSLLQKARASGVTGAALRDLFVDHLPNLRSTVARIGTTGLAHLVDVGCHYGFRGGGSVFEESSDIFGTPTFQDYLTDGIPALRLSYALLGRDGLEEVTRSLDQGPLQEQSSAHWRSESDRRLLAWNFLVRALPDVAERAANGDSQALRAEANEQARIFTLLGPGDGTQGVNCVRAANFLGVDLPLGAIRETLESLYRQTHAKFHEPLATALVLALSHGVVRDPAGLDLAAEHLLRLADSQESRSSVALRSVLVPALQKGMVRSMSDLSASVEVLLECERGTDTERTAFLETGVQAFISTGLVRTLPELERALSELDSHGPFEPIFWQRISYMLEEHEVDADLLWASQGIPLAVRPGLVRIFGEELSELKLDWKHFSSERDSLRVLVEFLHHDYPDTPNLLRSLQGAPGKMVANCLRDMNLVVGLGGQIHVPEGEAWQATCEKAAKLAFHLAIQDLGLASATRVHLERAATVQPTLLPILAGVAAGNRRPEQRELLREMVVAFTHDWRKWRYEERRGERQLAHLDPALHVRWQRNMIRPILLESPTLSEIRSEFQGRLLHIARTAEEHVKKSDPGFEVSEKGSARIRERIQELLKRGESRPLNSREQRRLQLLHRERIIVDSLLSLTLEDGPEKHPMGIARTLGRIRNALNHIDRKRSQTIADEVSNLANSFEREASFGPNLVFGVVTDGMLELLDTEADQRRCLRWSISDDATQALPHFAADAWVKKQEIRNGDKIFSLGRGMDPGELDQALRLLLSDPTAELERFTGEGENRWRAKVSIGTDGKEEELFFVNDSAHSRLSIYRSDSNGSYEFARLVTRKGKQQDCVQVIGPSEPILAGRYIELIPTSRGNMSFEATEPPRGPVLSRAMDVLHDELCESLGIAPFDGRRAGVYYPDSRHTHVYNRAVFGNGLVKSVENIAATTSVGYYG